MKRVVFALIAGMVGCTFAQPLPAAEASTFREKVLHSFCSRQNCTDGAGPIASLIVINGALYGTTSGGGAYGGGTVFSLDPNSGAEKVLHSFGNGTDGQVPEANLIDVSGVLYGTTAYGGGTGCGGYGCGTVFSLDPNTGAEKVLYSFCSQPNCADGAGPLASLIAVNGTLYGTTAYGGGTGCGGFDCGTVFSIDPVTGAEKVLYSFCSQPNCADGAFPAAGLIYVRGTLYGTTEIGGGGRCSGHSSGCGTVFAISPKTGMEKVLYSFCSLYNCADGEGPSDSLIDVNGMLYGTTVAGGSSNCSQTCGTVFALDPSSGAETVLHAFLGGTDGQWPLAGLIAVKGKLYGTTWYGGTHNSGTAFALDLKNSAETVVYSFCRQSHCADGGNPEASPIDVNGKLYGTTEVGGAYGYGTAFMLKKKR